MVIVFDLDDTLYDEIDFVKSGFTAVADFLGKDKKTYYNWMWSTFLNDGSGTIFNRLLESFPIDHTLQELIEVYRYHKPDIILTKEALNLLNFARNEGKTALITDGDSQTQIAKYEALHLEQWIDFPVFTSLYNTRKPEPIAFEMIMNYFSMENKFVYIADNPKKDFFAPIQLRWHTIRYNNPNGVYKSIISNAEEEVFSLSEALSKLQYLIKEN